MTTTSTKPEALLWIDVETTGPDRTTAQILEIGMACTDSTATQDYGAFHAIVKPDILDISRITPWAWEHHTANGLIAILGGPDPYTSHHEGRHRVEDCITRDIHDYRHYLETIQLKDSGK